MSSVISRLRRHAEKQLLPKIESNKLLHVRLDLDEKCTFDDVKAYLLKFELFLLSEIEYKQNGQQHVHMIVQFDGERKELRKLLKEKLLRCGPQLSTSIVKDFDSCMSYVMKDGYSLYKGIDPSLVEKLKLFSYKKLGKSHIKSYLEECRKRYLTNPSLTIDILAEEIIEFFVIANKTWSESHLKKTFRLWELQKVGNYRGYVAETFFYDIK